MRKMLLYIASVCVLLLAGCAQPARNTNVLETTNPAPETYSSVAGTEPPAQRTLTEVFDSGEFQYAICDGEVTITKIHIIGDDSYVSIPEQIEGMPVVAIGEHALDGVGRLEEILIPPTVRGIPDGIFDRLDPVFYVYDNTPAMEYLKTRPFTFALCKSGMVMKYGGSVEHGGCRYVCGGPGIVKEDMKSGKMRVLIAEQESEYLHSLFVYESELYFMSGDTLKKMDLDGRYLTVVWTPENDNGTDVDDCEAYGEYIYAFCSWRGEGPGASGSDHTLIRYDPKTGETVRYENIARNRQFHDDYVYCEARGLIYRVSLATGKAEALAGSWDEAANFEQDTVRLDGESYAVNDMPEQGHVPKTTDFFFVGDELYYYTLDFDRGRPFGLYRYVEGGKDAVVAEHESTEEVWSCDHRAAVGGWVFYTLRYIRPEAEYGEKPYSKVEAYRADVITGKVEMVGQWGGEDMLVDYSTVTYIVTDPQTGEKTEIIVW